jgi:hypothetical protein
MERVPAQVRSGNESNSGLSRRAGPATITMNQYTVPLSSFAARSACHSLWLTRDTGRGTSEHIHCIVSTRAGVRGRGTGYRTGFNFSVQTFRPAANATPHLQLTSPHLPSHFHTLTLKLQPRGA